MKIEKTTLMLATVVLLTLACFIPNVYSAQTEAYRGFYVFGHEVRTFQPCGSDTVYWFRADEEISKQLRDTHQKLTLKPYEPVYIEVQGHLTDKATEGFAADYNGQFVIEALDLVRARQEEDCVTAAVADAGITGVVWQWQQTRYNNDQNAEPDNPSRYTIAFQPDGSLRIRADCNRAGGIRLNKPSCGISKRRLSISCGKAIFTST
jgi:hypothetical protein